MRVGDMASGHRSAVAIAGLPSYFTSAAGISSPSTKTFTFAYGRGTMDFFSWAFVLA